MLRRQRRHGAVPVEHEVEDIGAVIDVAGGPAFAYGTSSGAALALEAAARGLDVRKLALWEPPFVLNESSRSPADLVERYDEMISSGRRGDAVESFMTQVVGLPPEFVTYTQTQPFWQAQEALAHTLAYDATVMGDYSLPGERAAVTIPTLVIAGGASFPFIRETARTLAEILPLGGTAPWKVRSTTSIRPFLPPCRWSSSRFNTAPCK